MKDVAVDHIGAIGGQISDHRCNMFRTAAGKESVVLLLGHQASRKLALLIRDYRIVHHHAGVGRWTNRVACDAKLGGLFGDRAGQPNDAGLGSTVVALANGALKRIG